MVKICQTRLLILNFEIISKKRIFRFLPKISPGHAWSWKFFFANFQILRPLGCQGWVVIPQNVKKSQNHCTLLNMHLACTEKHWACTEHILSSTVSMHEHTEHALSLPKHAFNMYLAALSSEHALNMHLTEELRSEHALSTLSMHWACNYSSTQQWACTEGPSC